MNNYIDSKMRARINQKLTKDTHTALQDGFKGRKTVNEVLDKPTVMTLHKMITSGTISRVDGSVGAGKESLLFLGADTTDANVALKIYLVSTSNFKRRVRYIQGDPRFSKFRKSTRGIVYLWAQKEFKNLTVAAQIGVRVPSPIRVLNNVLVMEFIGDNGRPAPTLLSCAVDDNDYAETIEMIRQLYVSGGLIHGDLSEYNIFKTKEGLVLFDLGSAVDRRHPSAVSFLHRDINNINRFFVKRGVLTRKISSILDEMNVS
ncbi:MAG: serine protein kinase RIO [Cenarchaeum sp. SB0665_bin_23]|nr:serine protein kinase RIO [Cenarchaeum sp. SB0667_bin_13]MXY60683.1 serine protein kinase RIO [Cenarchaeum sp. SB0665_bin_23]MXZ94229.1 serine protein kinase RIO [Cenarchaeum sp. SB0666_bin_15]MYB47458.1 serine protein kinase RIO [Cenarchaeum sp. SB0662_bin_33]MYC79806.1 serine protein kinase RIO [Cenarchaeum sp. SB0661_bin_35]MYD58957.1 serine protein kinase RIO [Cenarchaeum sp. SB0678_bin_8]MYG32869.1 serine protein kinase RIO [Cenarchaeum sp. SB0677_bin_16]MYI52366.1 serine protein kin